MSANGRSLVDVVRARLADGRTIADNDVRKLCDAFAEQEARIAKLADQVDEYHHAVGHLLDCDQGTTLCKQCARLVRAADQLSRPR